MLITIVNTRTKLGKFVLHKYPYQNTSLENNRFEDKVNSTDIMDSISKTYDYFAIYNKQSVIETSGEPLSEKAVHQIFMANQKNSQIIFGIDDNCVLLSKSCFMRDKTQSSYSQSDQSNQNGIFIDVNEEQESLVISISLIWRTDSYDNIQQQRHRLAYLIGVLQRKEQHSLFLTKQIKKIMEEKQNMSLRIKNLVTLNIKDNHQQNYDQFKLRIISRDIQQEAKKIREKVSIFRFLKDFYQCWMRNQIFQIKDDEGHWQGSIQTNFIVQSPHKQFINELKNKTLVMLPPKLAELLPSSLYSSRVKTLSQKAFNCDKLSFKKTLQKYSDLDSQQMYHTLYFLLKNNLAVDIYPIQHPFSYNIFALKSCPAKQVSDKFNRIFPGKSCIETISSYSKYRVLREQEQTFIYLLLKQIISEVKIYVYRKFQEENAQDKCSNQQIMLENILDKYNMSDVNLNQFLMIEPFPFLNKETTPVNAIIKFIKDHSKSWGFYFVE